LDFNNVSIGITDVNKSANTHPLDRLFRQLAKQPSACPDHFCAYRFKIRNFECDVGKTTRIGKLFRRASEVAILEYFQRWTVIPVPWQSKMKAFDLWLDQSSSICN